MSPFQYPVSDRIGCNLLTPAVAALGHRRFQYPVSDRIGCNYYAGTVPTKIFIPFSILCRIE